MERKRKRVLKYSWTSKEYWSFNQLQANGRDSKWNNWSSGISFIELIKKQFEWIDLYNNWSIEIIRHSLFIGEILVTLSKIDCLSNLNLFHNNL